MILREMLGGLRLRWSKRASAWALAALFAAILVGITGHGHAGDAAVGSDPCAVCSVANATGTALPASVPFLAPRLSTRALELGVEFAPAAPHGGPPLARSPPRATAHLHT